MSYMPGICHMISSSAIQYGSVILPWQCKWALKKSAGAISFLLQTADEKLDQVPETLPVMDHMSYWCKWPVPWTYIEPIILPLIEHSESVSLFWKKYLLLAGKAKLWKEEVSLFSLFKCFSFLEIISWLDFHFIIHQALVSCLHAEQQASWGFQNCGFTLAIQTHGNVFTDPTKGMLELFSALKCSLF